MLRAAITRLASASLTQSEARALMEHILAGQAQDGEIVELLAALNRKGETVEELVGFASAIRAASTPLPLQNAGTLVDTCGTGGDGRGTFNISTAAAFVAAGAGARVAKHGNRSVTSRAGSADVMEALGVKLELPSERLAACLETAGIVFLYAPALHTAMKHVQAARRQLKSRTIFNLLGPLTNPAGATAQVLGVYSPDVMETVAEALLRLGLERAFVVHGSDGADEITLSGPTHIAEVHGGVVRRYEIAPEDFGLARAPLSALAGGDVAENARIIRSVLEGERSPRRDVVLLNAAAALAAAGLAGNIRAALPLAERSLDSGAAREKPELLVRESNRR